MPAHTRQVHALPPALHQGILPKIDKFFLMIYVSHGINYRRSQRQAAFMCLFYYQLLIVEILVTYHRHTCLTWPEPVHLDVLGIGLHANHIIKQLVFLVNLSMAFYRLIFCSRYFLV
jgi:hypothetical protein